MNQQRVIFSLIVLFLTTTSERMLGQTGLSNARSFGMAGSYLALARGAEAPQSNPANLGLRTNPSNSFHFLALGVIVANNTLTKSDYDLYNGAWLNNNDKKTILQLLPAEGLHFQFGSEVELAAYSWQHFAATLSLEVLSTGRLARDFVDLALQGNALNRRYEFSGSSGAGFAAVTAGLSLGRPLSLPFLARYVQEFAVGTTVKYVHGLRAAEVVEAQGNLITTWEGLNGDGRTRIRSARGGKGLAFDWGAVTVVNPKLSFGLALRNVPGVIYWNQQVREYEWGARLDSVTAQSWNENHDTVLQSWSRQRRGPAFFSLLPTVLHAGMAYRLQWAQLAADVAHRLRGKDESVARPDLRLGMEVHYFDFLPLRFGLSTGGGYGWGTAFGLGYKSKTFAIDIAAQGRQGFLLFSGKGGGMALGMRLQM